MLARFYSSSGDAQATTRCVVPARLLPAQSLNPQLAHVSPKAGLPSVWQNPTRHHIYDLVADKQLGNRIVVDVDDPYFQQSDGWDPKDVEAHLEALAHADCVTCTTQPLADAYAEFHDDVRVIPSCVDTQDFELGRQMQHLDGKLRVGYAAGYTHAADAQLVTEGLRAISTRKDVLVEFVGDFDPGWDFAYRHYPALPYPAYKAMIATWSIGLAPLVDTPLNRTRSDLKALDYSMSWAATIVSPLGPFKHLVEQGVVASAETDDEWAEALTELIDNDDLRTQVVLNAHHYCRVERHPANQRTAYLDALALHRSKINV